MDLDFNKKYGAFRQVSHVEEYVSQLIDGGAEIKWAVKTGDVAAVRGTPGEEVITLMSDGTAETVNRVAADEQGQADWIVTNPGGERYIVPHGDFVRKYEPLHEKPGFFRPKSPPALTLKLAEGISFRAPWGETMHIKAGGRLVITDMKNIYGIQPEVFDSTYREI